MQRGEPALLEKSARAQAALRCGADLVLELPLPYACATAERFAFGAVASLDALGAVDALCFGSETGDLSLLEAAARALESQEFSGYFLRKHSDAAEIRKGALAAGRERMKSATVVRLSYRAFPVPWAWGYDSTSGLGAQPGFGRR